MIDQVLQLVKEHIGNNPAIAAAIPAGKQDAVTTEVASHIAGNVQGQGAGGMLSMLGGIGGMDISGITAGLADKLTGKLGLPPAAVSAIMAALPALLQKVTGQAAGNAGSAASNVLDSLPGGLGSKLGGFFK